MYSYEDRLRAVQLYVKLGKRIGFGRESMAPHSLTLTMVGASLLWVGWWPPFDALASKGRRRWTVKATPLGLGVLGRLRAPKLAKNDPIRGGIVHRLDKDTSGVLIFPMPPSGVYTAIP